MMVADRTIRTVDPAFPLLQGLSLRGLSCLAPALARNRGLDRRGRVSLSLQGNDWHVEEECVIRWMEVWRLV